MQMDRLVHAYLIYQQLDRGDGLPEVPDPPEGGTSLAPFTIEVLDSYCSYPIFFLWLINMNVFYSKSLIYPISAHPRGNFRE